MKSKPDIVGSLFWSFLERVGAQTVGLVVSTVLARFILPEDYGIIAAATIFTGLATTFVSGGFGNALIQKKDADDKDYSTMFIFNLVFSVSVYFIVFFTAPFLVKVFSSSFDQELLTTVVRILGIGIVFASFNSFYRAILTKKLLFRKLFKQTLVGTMFSGMIGIVLAYKGFGVWALVTQSLVSYFINSLIFVCSSKWRPKLYFSFERFKIMFSFGAKLLISGLMITAYTEMTGLVIGNRYSSGDLAYYKKGTNYPKLIVLNIVTAINTALFPILSSISDKSEQIRIVRKFNRISAFVITPMMFGFAAVAPAFVELLLTEKWLPCVPFLQLCCLSYAIQPLEMSSLQYLKAAGKATEYLVLDIVRKCIGIILIVFAVACNKGVLLVAFADVVSNFIAIFVNMYPGKKHIGYLIKHQIWDVLPKFVLSGVMFVAVYAINYISLPLTLKLVIQVIVGVVLYFGSARLLKLKELDELFLMGKSVLKK